MKSAPASRPSSPSPEDADAETRRKMLKFSFRKGGEKAFYAALKLSLQRKAWEGEGISKRKSTPKLGGETSRDGAKSGISAFFHAHTLKQIAEVTTAGILHNVQSNAQGRQTNMTDALQDLEALRIKAQDMVRLAAELNEKLTAASSVTEAADDMNSRDPNARVLKSNEPEEATFIRSSLSQLGLQMSDAPVTPDMITDEKKWITELAKELASVLQGSSKIEGGGGMLKARGIIALDEVWGGWNRARGVSMIPPPTFLQILPLLPQHTNPPIKTRKFSSGLTVLHTPPYGNSAFTDRLCSFLVTAGPQTTIAIAEEEGLTVGMTSMMLDTAEMMGDLVRDDVGLCSIVSGRDDGLGSVGLGEVEWHPNMFTGYVWDGET